ncbi:MAG: AprI/Inh family metalloprotease inhibitor [Xanthobacteraceae bacterium]
MRVGAVMFAAVAMCLCGAVSFAQDSQQNAAPSSETPSPAAPPQATQPPKDAVSAMIGAWEFSNADHDKICRFNFRADAVSGGNKLDIDKNCPNVFPSTKDIVAWALDNYGSLRLLDAHGNSVVELTEVESGMYDGFTPEEGRYILQTAAAAAPMRSANDMIGDWGIARGTGKPICVLTLANSPIGTDTMALKVKPGCEASIARFAPTAWRLDQGDLVLLSQRGESWQFEENDTNTWQRVPESADPFLLIRQ